jgi:site-specific recombinase XerD
MPPKREQTKPIPKRLQNEFYTCMWDLAFSGRFYRKVDPTAFATTTSFFHSFGSGKRSSALISRRHGLVVLWSTAAALRFHELAHLKLTDVDPHESTVFVRRGKGSKSETIPVLPLLIQCTAAWHRSLTVEIASRASRHCKDVAELTSVLLLPNDNGSRLDNKIFNRDVCGPLGRIFGIKLSHHCFRDTACDLGFEEGKDPRAVQRLMGHKSAQTTQIYADKSAPAPIQIPLFSGGDDGSI